MNDTIVSIAKKIDAHKNPSCETYCSTNAVESCIICEMIPIKIATKIYTAHVKPLEDALAKAEADNVVLAEALGDANDALPRALTWTTEPPKVKGFFWAIPRDDVPNWTVIKVIDRNGILLACPAGNPFAHELLNFRFWAGPIPEPKEPTV